MPHYGSQQFTGLLVQPAPVAELEGIAKFTAQGVEEFTQSVCIEMPARR